MTFNLRARDNTYNSENDFSANFTFSIWTSSEDSDWCWDEEAYVAICRHRGGDVRGNYGPVSLHRVDDSLADCGFLDWVLGWHVKEFDGFTEVDLDDLDETRARWILEESEDNEHLTERCSPGYSSLPSSELWDDCKSDSCYWINGSAILKKTDGGWLVATPYHYSSVEITTPDNGSGWLCDACIDTNSFIEETLSDDIFSEVVYEDYDVDWDSDDIVGKLCALHVAKEELDV